MHRISTALCLYLAVCVNTWAQEWSVATPESQGLDSASLAALVEYGANVQMDSLVVVRNGRVVAEAYYGPFRAPMVHRINSATKAVIGTLTGIAIARGDMPGTATPVTEIFPRADARWSTMTVQHLLDMTSGIDWAEPLSDPIPRSVLEMEKSRNWEEFVLGRQLKKSPGAEFNYNSGNPHLLSVALMRRTGLAADEYARHHLFEPLGITAFRWRKDPQGAAIGGFGLYLRTRDMARIGQLYLQHGEWNGRQVVPRQWADRVFTPKVGMGIPGFSYADFWWAIPARGAYMMVGYNRQLVLVIPELNMVVATTGRQNYPFEDLIAHLRRSTVSATALPENPVAQEALRSRIQDASAAKPLTARHEPSNIVAHAGRYQIEENAFGVKEIELELAQAPGIYRMRMRSRDIVAPLGLDGRFAEADDSGVAMFTRARWEDGDTLVIEQRWPEEAASVHYTLLFRDDDLEIVRTNDRGARASVKARRISN
jgi:CubicO group peptidase (beta-lactamase class C family)